MCPYISVFGRTFSAYGICMAAAFVLVGLLSYRSGKKWGVTGEDVLICGASACGIGLLAGGLLYVVVTYSPEIILQFLREGRIGELFGGIVFYGGLIGGILGGILGAKLAKCDPEGIAGVVFTCFPLGHAIGRIGCLLAGCCHGFAYTGPLAVYYPNAISGLNPNQGYFPVQALEALINVGIFVVLRALANRGRRGYDILSVYLLFYGVMRFLLEFLRGDTIRGIYGGVSLSQWISLGLIAAFAIYWWGFRKKQMRTE